jgi:5-methylcytosine-specific restriction endonuclease McrA
MLDRRTLVLNKSWLPISTTTVRRAVLLMARGAAGAVHPDTYEVATWDVWVERGPRTADHLEGQGFRLPVPEVIVLSTYNGIPDRPVAFTRRNVYRRDGFRCQYCHVRPGPDHLTIDHVQPRSRGGTTSWENCVTACFRCNARKANRSTREVGMSLRSAPHVPQWPGGLDPASLDQRPVWRRFFVHAEAAELRPSGTE